MARQDNWIRHYQFVKNKGRNRRDMCARLKQFSELRLNICENKVEAFIFFKDRKYAERVKHKKVNLICKAGVMPVG